MIKKDLIEIKKHLEKIKVFILDMDGTIYLAMIYFHAHCRFE